MEKKTKMRLVVERAPDAALPEDRGRLLEAHEVAHDIFRDKVKARWVLEKIPHKYRHSIGRMVMYYENDVRMWIETMRDVA